MNKIMDKEKLLILICMSIGSISFGLSMPILENEMVIAFGSKGVAIRRLTEFISTAIICAAYTNEVLRKIIKSTLLSVYASSVIISALMVICCWNKFYPLVFLIGYIISTLILYVYVGRSITGLRAWKFASSRSREAYDNSKNLWVSISAIIGFGISSFYNNFDLRVILILYLISSLGSIGWIVVYIRNKDNYLKDLV